MISSNLIIALDLQRDHCTHFRDEKIEAGEVNKQVIHDPTTTKL
jgi:hypothetical protein